MKESSREIAYRAVLESLEETSLFDLSMSQLKKKTGLSTGTVYYHFPGGIEDVLSGLFAEILHEMQERILKVIFEGEDLKSTFNSMLLEYFNWHHEEKIKSQFLWSVSAGGFKNFREIITGEYEDFSRRVYSHLTKLAKEEGRDLVPPIILDAFFLGATREIIHAWIARGRDDKELNEIKTSYIDIIYNSCLDHRSENEVR